MKDWNKDHEQEAREIQALMYGEQHRLVANHSGYDCPGSENWEFGVAPEVQNWSGVYDDVFNAWAEHEGWSEGYDYD